MNPSRKIIVIQICEQPQKLYNKNGYTPRKSFKKKGAYSACFYRNGNHLSRRRYFLRFAAHVFKVRCAAILTKPCPDRLCSLHAVKCTE